MSVAMTAWYGAGRERREREGERREREGGKKEGREDRGGRMESGMVREKREEGE